MVNELINHAEKRESPFILTPFPDVPNFDHENMDTGGLSLEEMTDPGMASSKWCFTLNNYTEGEMKALMESFKREEFTYICWGHEIAPKTGTPHLQGYFQTKHKRKLGKPPARQGLKGTGLKSIPGLRRAHLLITNGSPEQNIGYCKGDYTNWKGVYKAKNEKFIELGVPLLGGQGTRSDQNKIRTAVLAGNSVRQLIYADMIPNNQDLRFAQNLSMYVDHPVVKLNKPEIWWLYGLTNTFKSKSAVEMGVAKGYRVFMQKSSDTWWAGYTDQECVILDDVRSTYCTFTRMLDLLDRYYVCVQVKGTTFPLNAKMIIVTSAYHPSVVWRNKTDENLAQLIRRIDHIVEFEPPANYETIVPKPKTYKMIEGKLVEVDASALSANAPPEPSYYVDARSGRKAVGPNLSSDGVVNKWPTVKFENAIPEFTNYAQE